ncbi:NifB/NifX family molybdenum-iron cluster-binding protein [Thiolapillus sp.]
MKIAITSQNFKTITGHAGKTRRFLLYADDGKGRATEIDRLDLPREMSIHEFRGNEHPLQAADVLITAGCGDGFVRRMASWGIQVIATGETDPRKAAQAVLDGRPLPPPTPHEH